MNREFQTLRLYFKERDVRRAMVKLAATSWRVRERVRELASSHRLEQMQRLRMLEEKEAWRRKGGFDRIEITAEMHAQTLRSLHAGFDSEPLYIGIYNPRWLPTPDENTFEVNAEIDKMRLETVSGDTTATSLWFIPTTVARGRSGVGRTRSAACCEATNRAGWDFPFLNRYRWLSAR